MSLENKLKCTIMGAIIGGTAVEGVLTVSTIKSVIDAYHQGNEVFGFPGILGLAFPMFSAFATVSGGYLTYLTYHGAKKGE